MKKAVSLLSLTTPTSNRKRRRLRDTLAQLAKETEISPFPPRKRPSAEHSLSMGSLLDISNTPDTCKALAGEMERATCLKSYLWIEVLQLHKFIRSSTPAKGLRWSHAGV